jgi:hypothetical protein
MVVSDSGPTPTFKVDDKAIIEAIYDERERKDEAGKSIYFPTLDLSPRFTREEADALVELKGCTKRYDYAGSRRRSIRWLIAR